MWQIVINIEFKLCTKMSKSIFSRNICILNKQAKKIDFVVVFIISLILPKLLPL